LLKRPPGTAAAAIAGSALFLLHPLQSESVLYVWGRSEVLSTLFGLAAILLALRADEGPGPRVAARLYAQWALALGLLALGLGSKEEAVAVPAVFFLFWTLAEGKPARPGLGRAAVLAIPVALFLLMRAVALGGVGRQVYVRSVVDNVLGQAVVTLQIVRLIFLPIGQSVDHPTKVPGVVLGCLALAVCAAIALGAVFVAVRGARGPIAPGAAASRFSGGLLVAAVSSVLYWLVPLPDLMCERRLYLPLAGAALSLSGLLLRSRRRAFLATAALVLLLAPAMVLRARVWADPIRLWDEAARLAPGKARPLINLGVVAAEKGDRTGARDFFSRAITLEPQNAEALFNRGKLHLDSGEYREAIEDLKTSVASNPGLVRARINLAIARIDVGDLDDAEADLRAALAIEPKNPRALTNLAEVLRATDRAREAVAFYREALDADPNYSHAAARLGVTLENLGDRRGALAAYREFLVRGTTSSADRQAVQEKIHHLESEGSVSAPDR
jgi:tetratricopeptide (TPR) repeat protein